MRRLPGAPLLERNDNGEGVPPGPYVGSIGTCIRGVLGDAFGFGRLGTQIGGSGRDSRLILHGSGECGDLCREGVRGASSSGSPKSGVTSAS